MASKAHSCIYFSTEFVVVVSLFEYWSVLTTMGTSLNHTDFLAL